MMFLIGIAASLVVIWFAIGIWGYSWGSFIDIPPMLTFFALWVAVLMTTRSFKVFYAGMASIICPKKELPEEMRGRAASLLRLMSKTTGIMSAVIFLMLLISILSGADFWSFGRDPDFLNILYTNIGAALVTPFYGLWFIVAVFEPAVFILKKRPSGKR